MIEMKWQKGSRKTSQMVDRGREGYGQSGRILKLSNSRVAAVSFPLPEAFSQV